MSNITLNSVVYVGRGLSNGLARYISGASTSIARYMRQLSGRVNLGANVTAVRWAIDIPIVPEDDTCPCPGEAPVRSTMVEINVRMDARAPALHRGDVLASLQDLVQDSSFELSVTDLAQPGG